MKLNAIYAGLLILLIGSATSCNKDDNNNNPNPAPQNNQVIMRNDRFEPTTITVTPGTTVMWTNKEDELHTVTSDDTLLFDSGDMRLNKTYSYTFYNAGTYKYHCKYHRTEGMVGTVIVH